MRGNRTFLSFLLVLSLGFAAGREVRADEPLQPRRLVKQLGDSRFAVRERAARQLARIGLEALPELQQGTRSPDREVSSRCEQILVKVREIDFQRRLHAFLMNRDGNSDYGLSGWQMFRTNVGDGPVQRGLFAEMQQAEWPLLQSLEENPERASELLTARMHELQQIQHAIGQLPAVGSVATMIYLAGISDTNFDARTAQILTSFCYQQPLREEIQSGRRHAILQNMLGTWIRRCEGWSAYQAMTLAMIFDIESGLTPALQILTSPLPAELDSYRRYLLQHAILTTAKFGDESHIRILEGQLGDETVCSTPTINKTKIEAQVRDIALAAMIHLSGKSPDQFGFQHIQANPTYVFNYNSAGFANDRDRQAAFKKWYDFASANK